MDIAINPPDTVVVPTDSHTKDIWTEDCLIPTGSLTLLFLDLSSYDGAPNVQLLTK